MENKPVDVEGCADLLVESLGLDNLKLGQEYVERINNFLNVIGVELAREEKDYAFEVWAIGVSEGVKQSMEEGVFLEALDSGSDSKVDVTIQALFLNKVFTQWEARVIVKDWDEEDTESRIKSRLMGIETTEEKGLVFISEDRYSNRRLILWELTPKTDY